MDYSKEIIALVKNEKQNYESGSQEIRELIKKSRQNYWCKFESDYDSSGREKIFIPMTRWEVDTVTSKIYVNEKALTVIPENENSVRSSFIADKVVKHQIRETRFPTYFRNSMHDLGIDGTNVWALYWDFEREMLVEDEGLIKKVKNFFTGSKPNVKSNVLKDKIGFKKLDLLNCFIDPTADSLQDAPSFIYRDVKTLDAVKRNKLYKNTDKVVGFKTENSDTYDARSTRKWAIEQETLQYELPMCAVYERWGMIPKQFITGKKKDEGQMVNGVITIADLDGNPIILRVEKTPFAHGKKPFEECWYQKIQGRWYGVGIGEKLIPLQKYLNKTVNRSMVNEDLLQNGLFKKKRGSGLSVKNIISTPGGVIEVDNMTDLEQLQTKDVSQLSQATINRIQAFVERINGASEIATGSAADRSATTSLIKDRNADTRFAEVRGNINDFLLRFFKMWMSLDRQFIDRNFVVRITGEDTELNEIDKMLGIPPELSSTTPFRFINVDPETIQGDFDLEVDIDQSQPMNKAENSQRILNAIQVGKSLGLMRDYERLFDTYLDMVGLQGSKYKVRMQPGMMMNPMGTPPNPNEVGQMQNANSEAGMNTTELMSAVGTPQV